MSMLSQTIPIKALGCPAGACREQTRTPAKTSLTALLAAFAAGALVVSAITALAVASAAPKPAPISAEQKAAAASWVALMQEQTPHVLPREWRYEIKTVDFSGMFPRQR